MYKVKLEQFEGPMDLLVYLIEHARMSIYDIQVSEITAQYLGYIAEMKRQDVAVAQEFMVLAAELIELKSRMLLPGAEENAAAEDPEDPRSALVARILEYKQFKEAAAFLAEQQEAVEHVHTKPQEDISRYTDDPDELLKSDLDKFAEAFRAFLLRKQRLGEMRRTYERIERQRMSVETRIGQIRSLFSRLKKKKLLFSELLGEDVSRFNKVITFMSLLEMLKDKRVSAVQKKRFGDISVSLTEEQN
mgnify:CR=1 FL=1